MIHRDLLFQAYQMNCNYYIDLLIKEDSIKIPTKSIISETVEYLKNTAKHIDAIIEKSSIFLHKQYT